MGLAMRTRRGRGAAREMRIDRSGGKRRRYPFFHLLFRETIATNFSRCRKSRIFAFSNQVYNFFSSREEERYILLQFGLGKTFHSEEKHSSSFNTFLTELVQQNNDGISSFFFFFFTLADHFLLL